jgi:uncharacterized membrane protein
MFFDAGILIKGIYSVIEVIVGTALLFVNADNVKTIATAIFGDETDETLFRTVWDFTAHSFAALSNNSQFFLAITFLLHGIVKIILIIGLAKEKLWVFPLAGITFTFFGVYQIYQMTVAPSAILVALTIIDAIFVALIIHEYGYQKKLRAGAAMIPSDSR